jgi:hypothetical protein
MTTRDLAISITEIDASHPLAGAELPLSATLTEVDGLLAAIYVADRETQTGGLTWQTVGCAACGSFPAVRGRRGGRGRAAPEAGAVAS